MDPETTILAIDPSSSCSGWAIGTTADVIDHGRWYGRGIPIDDRDYVTRPTSMVAECRSVIAAHRPAIAIIEEPAPSKLSPRVQYQYAEAFGRLYQVTMDELDGEVRRVPAAKWTRNRPKAARAACIEQTVASYTTQGDSGLDEADAIGLLQWFQQAVRFDDSWEANGRFASRKTRARRKPPRRRR